MGWRCLHSPRVQGCGRCPLAPQLIFCRRIPPYAGPQFVAVQSPMFFMCEGELPSFCLDLSACKPPRQKTRHLTSLRNAIAGSLALGRAILESWGQLSGPKANISPTLPRCSVEFRCGVALDSKRGETVRKPRMHFTINGPVGQTLSRAPPHERANPAEATKRSIFQDKKFFWKCLRLRCVTTRLLDPT